MSESTNNRSRRRHLRWTLGRWLGGAVSAGTLAAALLPACGGHEEAMQSRINELEERLEEMERDSGRSMVRLEDTSDRINLLTDRVETNRLALERRGVARPLPVVVARPNDPTGQTGSWSPPPYTPPARPSADLDRGYKRLEFDEKRIKARIKVPGTGYDDDRARAQVQPVQEDTGDYEDVTITEDDYKRFVEEDGGTVASAPTGGGGGGSAMKRAGGGGRKRAPQPDVVHDETLPVVDSTPVGKAARDVADEDLPSTPMEAYKGALASYRAGNYSKALAGFKRYLDMGPSEDYLDNAYYWIGECSYGLGEHQQAIAWFDRVIKETPGGNKVPDSMLKASLAYTRMGKPDQARVTLLNLVETYPSTNAAKLATEKLKELD